MLNPVQSRWMGEYTLKVPSFAVPLGLFACKLWNDTIHSCVT